MRRKGENGERRRIHRFEKKRNWKINKFIFRLFKWNCWTKFVRNNQKVLNEEYVTVRIHQSPSEQRGDNNLAAAQMSQYFMEYCKYPMVIEVTVGWTKGHLKRWISDSNKVIRCYYCIDCSGRNQNDAIVNEEDFQWPEVISYWRSDSVISLSSMRRKMPLKVFLRSVWAASGRALKSAAIFEAIFFACNWEKKALRTISHSDTQGERHARKNGIVRQAHALICS